MNVEAAVQGCMEGPAPVSEEATEWLDAQRFTIIPPEMISSYYTSIAQIKEDDCICDSNDHDDAGEPVVIGYTPIHYRDIPLDKDAWKRPAPA